VVPLPGRCEQSAFRVQWYGAFLDFYLPQTKKSPGQSSLCVESWTRYIPYLAVNTPALTSAFDALATVRLAQLAEDKQLLNFSTNAYGKALSAVRRAIADPKRECSTEYLATMMVLALYEVYGGSVDRAFGWTSHIQAASSVFRHQKGTRNLSELDKQLLLGLRLDTVS
jgi:hypothetical protein